MTTELTITTDPKPDGTVVEVAGEIDMATAPTLTDCLAHLQGRIVIDLAHVTFLDSSGIGALIQARKRGGSELVLRHPQNNVRRVLELVGLDDWIEASPAQP